MNADYVGGGGVTAMQVSLRGMRTRERLAAVIAVGLVGAAGLAACSSGSSSASPFSGKTPAQVLALANAAALAKGSEHIVQNNNIGGTIVDCVTDAGTTQGKQVLTSSTAGNATILVVSPQMAYFQADATYLEQNSGVPADEAAKYAGQWISVPSSSPDFASLVTQLTISSANTEHSPSAPLSFTKPTTIDGQSVVGVSGGLDPEWPSGFTGTQVRYISTAAPYLPVAAVIHGKVANGGTLTVTFHVSDYGEPMSVTAPANSIPMSAIPS